MKKNNQRWRLIKVMTHKYWHRTQRRLAKYWNINSGEWSWLNDQPMPVAAINRHLWRLSVPSFSFHLLLGLSGIIATFGLLANSVAIIIGAMIIAPLMGPIIGIAYAMTIGNRRLLRRSSLTLGTGVLLTVFLSWMICHISGLKSGNSEILARANPTLIDLGVALAAGAAGAFANSRRHIADALPGVAIAVALAPPLSVTGIALCWGERSLFTGSLLLFTTNLISIIFSGGLVFLLQRYGKIKKAQHGLLVSVLTLMTLGIPLGIQMKNLIIQEQVRQSIRQLIDNQNIVSFKGKIYSIKVKTQEDQLLVNVEIATQANSINVSKANYIRELLTQEFQQPVRLELTIIPVEVIRSNP